MAGTAGPASRNEAAVWLMEGPHTHTDSAQQVCLMLEDARVCGACTFNPTSALHGLPGAPMVWWNPLSPAFMPEWESCETVAAWWKRRTFVTPHHSNFGLLGCTLACAADTVGVKLPDTTRHSGGENAAQTASVPGPLASQYLLLFIYTHSPFSECFYPPALRMWS